MSELTTQQITHILDFNVNKVAEIIKKSQEYTDILDLYKRFPPDDTNVLDEELRGVFCGIEEINSGKFVVQSSDDKLFFNMCSYFHDDYEELNYFFDYFKDIVIIPKITTRIEYTNFLLTMGSEINSIAFKKYQKQYEIKNHFTFRKILKCFTR